MNFKIEEKQKTWWKKLTAPFMVLRIEKFYGFWIISYMISFAGIIIDLFNHDFSNSINNGMVFSTCMAVIAPLLIEFLSDYIAENRRKSKEEYSVYKGWTMATCVVVLILLFLFYGTEMKSSFIAQLVCFLLVFVISFYTYLVTKMQIHSTLLDDFKDQSYADAEKEALNSMEGSSKKLKRTTGAEGVDIKL